MYTVSYKSTDDPAAIRSDDDMFFLTKIFVLFQLGRMVITERFEMIAITRVGKNEILGKTLGESKVGF
jgi:hypothetical protein